jgi:hypothetical protein
VRLAAWPEIRVMVAGLLAIGLIAGWTGRYLAAQGSPLPAGKHVELVIGRCIICHSLEVVSQQRQDRAGWEAIVDRMMVYGAPIAPDEKDPILEYLVTHFGS